MEGDRGGARGRGRGGRAWVRGTLFDSTSAWGAKGGIASRSLVKQGG